MSNQAIKIGLLISADGANQTVRSLQQIQAELDRMKAASKQSAIASAQAATQLAQSLGTSYKNAREFAQSLGLTAEKAQGAISRMGELDRAGASVAEKFRVLGREFGLTRQQFEGLNASFNQNTKSQEQLARSLGITIDGARNFAKDIGLSAGKANEAVGRYRELSSVGATLAEKQRVLTQELGLTSKQFDAVRGAALASQQGLAGVTAIAGGVAAALGNIANQGVQAFVEFDQSIRTFGVISEGTTAQVGAVRDEIERLGTTTTKTPKEVAALGIELAKAGFKANQVKDALAGVVLASQATGEDLARTGEVIGNIINQFQLKAGDSAKIADLLTATSNASASGVNDLGEALSYAGTSAAQSGQSLKDTLFALGQLANAGIKGSSAGTGLAEALRRLKLASANASTELNDLRSKGAKNAIAAFNKVNESVRDVNGQLLPLPQVLKNLQSGLEGVSEVDKDLIMNALFGVQGGRVVQTLVAGNAEQVNGLKDALDNSAGAAQRAGEALTQGPQAAMQRLQAATSVALVSIGEFVSVAFLPMINASELLLGTFNALPAPLQLAVVSIGGVAAALAAATAAVATYNLAKGATIVEETLSAAATVRDTLVKGASTAATLLQTGATTAQAFVQKVLTTEINLSAIATKAWALVQGVGAAASAVWAAVTSGQLVPSLIAAKGAATSAVVAIGPFLAIAALAAAAVFAVSEAFKRSEGAKFAQVVNENTEALKKLRAEADKEIKPKVDANPLEKLIDDIQNKGLVEGIQTLYASFTDGLDGQKDAATTYGNSLGAITSKQRGAQLAQLALEEQFKQTNTTIDGARSLIEKYGLSQVTAADKTRLGTKGIAEFQEAGKKQIATIEQTIEVLNKQKDAATNPEQKTQIQQEIDLLESSKAALQKRAQQLTADTKALKTNADAAKDAAKAQEDLKEIIKSFESGKLSSNGAVDQLAAIASNADAEVKLRREASEEIVKIRQSEIQEVQKALATGQQTEAEAIEKLKQIRASSASSPESEKAAADAITKIRKDQTDAEIATLQAGAAAIEALQARGKLTEAEADKRITQLKAAEIQKRIEQARSALENASGSERTKLLAEETKLQADLDKLRAEAQQRDLKRRLAEIDRFVQEGQAKLAQAETERQVDVQQLINAGVVDQQQAEALKADATRDRLQEEFTLAQQQVEKLAAIKTPDNPESARELETKKQAARKQTTDLTLQLLQVEAAAQERVRQAAIRAIDDALSAKTRAYDRELSQLEAVKSQRDRSVKATEAAAQKEVAALEVATRSLERQNTLLGARANLQKAKSDAATSATEIELEAINQQLQANQKDAGLLQQKAALETQLAVQKRQALLEQQASEKAGLLLEIKRNELAAKRQLIEAQIAESKAKQAVLDAQSALQQQRITDQKAIGQAQADLAKAEQLAPGRERDRAVADAQSKVQITQQQSGQNQANAQQQVQLAQQQVQLTQQSTAAVKADIANTKEINQLQQQTLEIEQATALKRFDAAEALRQQRIEQEAITQAASEEADARERSAKAGGASPAALPARRLGGPVSPGQPFVGAEEGAEAVRYHDGSYGLLTVPGVYQVPRSGTVLTAGQTAAMMRKPGAVTLPKGVQSARGEGALIQEVRALRDDLATVGATTTNQFQIVADEDPYRRMAEIAATVNRARWR